MGRFPVTYVLYRTSRASTGLSKHGSLCYRRFDDFQGACAGGGGGYARIDACNKNGGWCMPMWPLLSMCSSSESNTSASGTQSQFLSKAEDVSQ